MRRKCRCQATRCSYNPVTIGRRVAPRWVLLDPFLLNRFAASYPPTKDRLVWHEMSVNGTWLNAGTALLDAHDRIIESNEEFAFWARTAQVESALFVDVLSR